MTSNVRLKLLKPPKIGNTTQTLIFKMLYKNVTKKSHDPKKPTEKLVRKLTRMLHFKQNIAVKRGRKITCHGLSQSSGIGQAPNQAPITAPCAGRQII